MLLTSFPKKLKKIRLSHRLNGASMSKLIGMHSKGSYSNLENAKNPPSFQTLTYIAEIFAVSIDWLIGRISQPYNAEIIINEEKNLFPLYMLRRDTNLFFLPSISFIDFPLQGEKIIYFPLNHEVPQDYQNENSRKKTYSLQLRANIIYITHLMNDLVSENPTILQNTIPPIHIENDLIDPPLPSPNIKLYTQCIAWLKDIFENRKQAPLDKQEPLFDILKNE